MICPICGRTIEEDAHFCPNCGASLRSGFQYEAPRTQAPSAEQSAEGKKMSETVSFGNWFGTLILPFIPIVGSIVFFVMLIVWSVKKEGNESKRNWARAELLVSVLVFVMLVGFVSSMMRDPSFQSMFQEYLNMLQ